MTEQIDVAACKAVMERAVELSADPITRNSREFMEWSSRVRAFSEHCAKKNLKTYIAVLGNALLSKATNPRVDVYSLKAGDASGGAYDARRSAENVLVPASKIHRFSLGVSGPQPLNNQPFFREYRIDKGMTVRSHARPVLEELLTHLHEAQQLRAEEATRALAAFVDVRREYVPRYAVAQGALAVSTGPELSAAIASLVDESSDGGGRAQSAAGGLMDALFSVERVRVGKRNEPDRQMPGDVGVRKAAGDPTYSRILEVRDKNVPDHAALSFVEKLAAAGVGRGVIVAIAKNQQALNVLAIQSRAKDAGVDLDIYLSWSDLVRAAVFASDAREIATVEAAVSAIRARLIEQELAAAVSHWDSLTLWKES